MEALARRQSATLKVVLVINVVMFVIELGGGLLAGSSALMSDALDNLGDALTYGVSLYAVSRGPGAKARAALFKGVLILAAGVFAAAQVLYRLAVPAVPIFEAMGAISVLALTANGACLALLWKHRREDVNMSSVWECSRNDIASNLAVLVAAAGVWLFASRWPDLVVGALLAALFLRSAVGVLCTAREALRTATA